MLLLLLPLLLQAGLNHGEICAEAENDFPEGCDDEPNIAKIVCMGEEHCVCKDGDTKEENPCTNIIPANVLFEVTAAEMDGQRCRKICETSKASARNSSKCEYFRWEEDLDLSEHCTLMSAGQCLSYSPCEGHHCLSGQAGCDRAVPGGATCQGGALYSEDRHAVHWSCTDTWDIQGRRIDIYGVQDIPSGTVCMTTHR